jgi:hypothetical protein
MAAEDVWDTSWLFGKKNEGSAQKAPDDAPPEDKDPESEEDGDASLAAEVRSTQEAVRSFLPRGFRVDQVSIAKGEARVIATFPRGDADTLARSLRAALEGEWKLDEVGSTGRQLWARLVLPRLGRDDG